MPLLYAGIILSSNDVFNQVVCGLPINQYKKNKSTIEELISNNKMKTLKVNGEPREIVITDFIVYPEGIGAYYSLYTSEDVIIVDIGGRTTDIAYICDKMIDRIIERGTLKVDNIDIDLRFITGILKENFMKIKEDLDFKFPARTEKIVLCGGGAKLFAKAFMRRYSNCEVAEEPIFANSIGFKKVGESLWK